MIAIALQLIGTFVVAIVATVLLFAAGAWVIAALRNLTERWER